MKNIDSILKAKYTPYIIIFLLTLVICAPMFTIDLSSYNEARIHLGRIIAIDEVIKEGVFPPIISSNYMNNFGYALNLFYGPITTYIPIILLNIFNNLGIAFKIFTMFTVFLSGITMYKFVYTISKRRIISLISALIYISVPYKLSNIYSRNAVGEYTAFIFIPMVFEGLYNLIYKNKNKSYLLCLGIIGLVLSHTITTIYIALFSIIYLIFNIKKLKDLEIWKKSIISIFIAFLVCSFYVWPLLEHKFYADYTIFSQEQMKTSGEYVFDRALPLSDLFKSEFGNQEIRFSIGLVVILLSLLGILSFKKINKNYKKVYIDFSILSIITLFMCTTYFPWDKIPDFMAVIQFPWRNLGFFTFFISLVCSINIVTLIENITNKINLRDTFIFAVLCSIFVFTFLGVLREWKWDDLNREKVYEIALKENETFGPFNINRDYMPLRALKNIKYVLERENRTYLLQGQATIVSEEKDKLTDKIVIKNVEDGSIIELPYLYYLGYTVEVQYSENETKKINYTQSENGFIQLKLENADNVTINIEYTGSILEKVSYCVSLIGILLLIVYIKKENKYEKNR